MTRDPFYPTIDTVFIEDAITKSTCIVPNSRQKIGKTTAFVMCGSQPMFKRLILLREVSAGQISYEQATGLAIKLGFLSELMDWLKVNKHWHEGAFVAQSLN